MLLSVSHLTIFFGAQLVLDDVSLLVNAGDRVGLVGANGSGKTTLLRAVAGELKPDTGDAVISPAVRIGYLPQVLSAEAGSSLEQLLRASQGPIDALELRMRALEDVLSRAQGEDLAAALLEYGEVREQFERLGGYALDARFDAALLGLGIAHLPRDRALGTLSGGERERAGLAALMLSQPDLLLLDEPTNHLDAKALDWLAAMLTGYRGGVLVASHDRAFLNRAVNQIVEIDDLSHRATNYAGNYDAYAAAQAYNRATWIKEYAEQQEEIKELKRTIRQSGVRLWHGGAKAGNDKFAKGFFKGRAEVTISRERRNAEERLLRLEESGLTRPPDEIRITPEFDPGVLEGKLPLRAEGLRKAYGGNTVLADAAGELAPGQRIVLTGPNGCGKSTLLRVLAGVELPDAGRVSLAPTSRLGYLEQEPSMLDPRQNGFDWWREGLTGDEETLRAEFFRFFLLTYEDASKPVTALSTGQKRKLQLLKLIAVKANVLLLDEPTNHISLDVLDKFERALLAFPGPILAASHDRFFIERFATQIWRLEAGRIKVEFLG